MAKTHHERWEETFKPIKNHLTDNTDPDHDGRFETFGRELEYVLSVANSEPNRVWTLVEGDSGKWYISQGYHLVNRVGYYITEKPFEPTNPKHARYATRDVFYC